MICLLRGNMKDLNFQGYCQGNLWGARDGVARKAPAGASHPEKNYCLITGRSKSIPDTQARGKSIWPLCSKQWLSERHLVQTPKIFHCGYAYLAINEYTETEVAWIGKAPVPCETIRSSLLLVPPFCCCFSSWFISAREWVWVGRRRSSPWLPRCAKGRWGESKRNNSWAHWDLSIITAFWLIG